MKKAHQVWLPILLVCLATVAASAQSFRVQCPTSTVTHPFHAAAGVSCTKNPTAPGCNNSEPAYVGPSYAGTAGYPAAQANVNGAIKCQQISGGDGYSTMGDGTQTYMFSFGPLSGISDIANGQPGTQYPNVFNVPLNISNPGAILQPGDPATSGIVYNGAVGLTNDIANLVSIYDIAEDPPFGANRRRVTVQTNSPLGLNIGDSVKIAGTGLAYDGTWTITGLAIPIPRPFTVVNYGFPAGYNFTFTLPNTAPTGLPAVNTSQTATAATLPRIDGHVDPRQIMDVGVMNGNIPAPLMAIDEDDEYFLTLTNVGMIMRPDLFEQHTVHFHGYPNASAFYDGVPDASVAINIGASFTYYYLAPDAGTYFWHCHITPPEHLQMGMVGQIYVRPRQNRVPAGTSLFTALQTQQTDLRTKCDSKADILCSNPLPADLGILPGSTSATTAAAGVKYAYNDGDGSTAYDVEYPLQIHGFDPNFHFVGMTFNPEGFADMKDKYFLLNGRSYPDTVTAGPLQTQSSDGVNHFSQPLPAIIDIPHNGKALLRISDLDVSEYQTLASLGIPMKVIALNAKLLRDQAGVNLYYTTNSITLGGGESLDVILDSTGVPPGTYYLYTPNLDHLSNDAENFGGLMTEVHVN